jgi:hypothetical protein
MSVLRRLLTILRRTPPTPGTCVPQTTCQFSTSGSGSVGVGTTSQSYRAPQEATAAQREVQSNAYQELSSVLRYDPRLQLFVVEERRWVSTLLNTLMYSLRRAVLGPDRRAQMSPAFQQAEDEQRRQIADHVASVNPFRTSSTMERLLRPAYQQASLVQQITQEVQREAEAPVQEQPALFAITTPNAAAAATAKRLIQLLKSLRMNPNTGLLEVYWPGEFEPELQLSLERILEQEEKRLGVKGYLPVIRPADTPPLPVRTSPGRPVF